jgi:carboxypeptidase PM20D1
LFIKNKGLTDSRYYAGSTKNIYKFTPIRVKNSDMKRFHGADERISIENFENLINFYFFLIDNTDKAHLNVKDEAASSLCLS